MPNITLSVTDDLKTNMDQFREVSWSEVCRRAIRIYIEGRRSENPVARAKFLALKEEESSLGYKFGIEFSEDVVNQLNFDQIKSLLWVIAYWEAGNFPEYNIEYWIMDSFHDPMVEILRKDFEENEKKVGRFEWLLAIAALKDEFHKNMTFIKGMLRGLNDILR